MRRSTDSGSWPGKFIVMAVLLMLPVLANGSPGIPGGIDERLVGLWRHTAGDYSGSFSMTTDTFYRLQSDGTFETWSHTVGSAGETRSEREYGRWRAGNGRIFIQEGSGEVSSTAYQLSRDGLFLPEETHFRFWDRVR
jgi:hypothetical protein